MRLLLLHNKLNLGALFDTIKRKTSSTYFTVKAEEVGSTEWQKNDRMAEE